MNPNDIPNVVALVAVFSLVACADPAPPCEMTGIAGDSSCDTSATATCRDPSTGRLRAVLAPSRGILLISELMADPSAVPDADGEWIELSATADVDLNSIEIRAGAASASLRGEECLRLGAGTYALLARERDPLVNGGLPSVASPLGVGLGNGSGTLAVWSADGALLDQISWQQQKPGVAWQLDPSRSSVAALDDPSRFCPAIQPWGESGELGTPAAANSPCPERAGSTCVDPSNGTARSPVAPAHGQLVISELMADPTQVADSAGEWIEVYARSDVDLNGLQLSNGKSGTRTLTSPTCLRISAGGFAVFARTREPTLNGGVAGALDTFGFGLSQSSTTADAPHALALVINGTEIDRVTWTSATAGASTQLSATALVPSPPGTASSFCVAPLGRTYGLGDRGTPGAMNAVCP